MRKKVKALLKFDQASLDHLDMIAEAARDAAAAMRRLSNLVDGFKPQATLTEIT